MTKYFFNIRSAQVYICDAEGQDHENLPAAMEEAETSAREMISEAVKHGEPIDSSKFFEITDASGALCATLPFRDVVKFS
jgi:hypothetical protein